MLTTIGRSRSHGLASRSVLLASIAALLIASSWASPVVYAGVPGPTRANDDSVVTNEDSAVTFDALDNDAGGLDPSSVSVLGNPLHGTATAHADGTITYRPAPHYNGSDTFGYGACDATGTCDTAQVTVTVTLLGSYRIAFADTTTGTELFTFSEMLPDASAEERLVEPSGSSWISFSPDGRKVAILRGGSVNVHFLDGSMEDQHAVGSGSATHPSWSPSSESFAFEADAENPDPNLPGSVHAIWTFSISHDPLAAPTAEPMKYQVPDGAGGTKSAYVEGNNPTWGTAGIVFDHFNDEDSADCESVGGPPCAGEDLWLATGAGKPTQYVIDSLMKMEQPAWSRDGRLAFIGRSNDMNEAALYTVVGDDPPMAIATINRGDPLCCVDASPAWSPDGSKIAYHCCTSSVLGEVYVINADGTNMQPVTFTGRAARVAWDTRPVAPSPLPSDHPGHLLYDDAFSGHFLKRMRPDGSGLTSFLQSANPCCDGDTGPAWSPDGSKIALSTLRTVSSFYSNPSIGVMNADGTAFRLLTDPMVGRAWDPAWSPDGSRIVYGWLDLAGSGGLQLWTMAADGSDKRQLTSGSNFDKYPAWSPDGAWIAFMRSSASTATTGTLMVVAATGGVPASVAGSYPGNYPAWSPDGRTIAFSSSSFGLGLRIALGDFTASPAPALSNIRALTPGRGQPDNEFSPTWSPDGLALAYTKGSGSGGQRILKVINLDGTRPTTITDPTRKAFDPDWGGVPRTPPPPPPPPSGPTITSISPTSGPTSGGTAVTISGTNLGPGTRVTFGAVDGTVTGGSGSTSLNVTTPAHSAATVDVIVTNSDGQSGALANAFTFVNPSSPTIKGIKPTSGPATGGTTVTITGTNFKAGAILTFGGVAATNVVVSGTTKVTCTTPPHAAGKVDVILANPDGGSVKKAGAFTYTTRRK